MRGKRPWVVAGCFYRQKLPKPWGADAGVFHRQKAHGKQITICFLFSAQLMGGGELLRSSGSGAGQKR